MNLKGTRSNFTPWLRDFEHQGENCLGGLLQPPFGEQGLKGEFVEAVISPSRMEVSYCTSEYFRS